MFAVAEEWTDWIAPVCVGLVLAGLVALALYDVVREWRGPRE